VEQVQGEIPLAQQRVVVRPGGVGERVPPVDERSRGEMESEQAKRDRGQSCVPRDGTQ
jgi:hypothetical protein